RAHLRPCRLPGRRGARHLLMTTIVQPTQVRLNALGLFVRGAAKTVPQNATQTVFTVTGGRILVSLLQGIVTTQIGGTTPNGKLVSTPTTGTAGDLTTTGVITGKEVGAQFSFVAVGSALDVQNAFVGKAPTTGIVIPIGT